MDKITEINKRIENCPISELKELSNLKRTIIYGLINKIMGESGFPLDTKKKIERLKNEVDTITTILRERRYLDDNKLNKGLKICDIVKKLAKKKMELENEIFILEL